MLEPKQFNVFRATRWAGLILIIVGICLCAIYGFARVHSVVSARILASSFVARAESGPAGDPAGANCDAPRRAAALADIDFSDWSQKRIAAYKKALAMKFEPAMAILTIPKLGIEVPVLNGTDAVTLDRAVGRIIGTAKPDDEIGNIGIAGHRDGFFRELKNIAVGDAIIVSSQVGRKTYRVDSIQIVTPNDVSVLDQRGTPSITLVTCYPFYFIGDAPQCYVVQASLNDATGARPQP